MAIVLIVEDQEQILTLAQSFLEEQGHKTLSAATADEALAILTGSEAVDALFVDIILNGDTQAGLELAKRAVELKPRLKVVYSTGLSVTDEMKDVEGASLKRSLEFLHGCRLQLVELEGA